MATNPYFRTYESKNEQNLLNALTIETIKAMGRDVIYIPRDYLVIDKIFGEDPASKFSNGYPIEMYMLDVEAFQGNRDIVAKFGIQVTDRTKFILSKTRFEQEVYPHRNEIKKPREGDLIYLPLSGSLFEINFVEDEIPFYQHGALTTYVLSCELFTYSGEDIETGITDIDVVATSRNSYMLQVPVSVNPVSGSNDLIAGETIYQVLGVTGTAGVTLSVATATSQAIQFVRGEGITLSQLYLTNIEGTLSFNTDQTLKGNISGAEYKTTGTSITTDIIVPQDPKTEEPVVDNDALQTGGINIFDFTDVDPFSSGNY